MIAASVYLCSDDLAPIVFMYNIFAVLTVTVITTYYYVFCFYMALFTCLTQSVSTVMMRLSSLNDQFIVKTTLKLS